MQMGIVSLTIFDTDLLIIAKSLQTVAILKIRNLYISACAWLISTTFCVVINIGPMDLNTCLKIQIFENPR